MIQFELPQDVEEDLRKSVGNLDDAARAAFLVQSYREGRLSVGQIGEILGIGVLGAEEWLAERKVELNYTLEDLESDTKTLAALFPDAGL